MHVRPDCGVVQIAKDRLDSGFDRTLRRTSRDQERFQELHEIFIQTWLLPAMHTP